MYTVTEFTPIPALIGGLLIGSSALLMLGALGRIAGISGIAGNLLQAPAGDRSWRLAFVLGLLGGAASYLLFAPADAIHIHIDAGWGLMLGAGLLVGVGTRLGSGCTSGHGVCGIGRLSPRSLVATGVFMAVAIGVVAVMRHGLGV
nr:YeeE/YedE family protein [Oceanococcus sp. HetDA_MAG_MS8]